MARRPIFVATHPRACSTAFERVFMTRPHQLECVHEPFGDAFYYGPERIADRFDDDEDVRSKSGFKDVTFQHVLDRLTEAAKEGKEVFIKDMAYYIVPPAGRIPTTAPSLGPDESPAGNPTVFPLAVLEKFRFVFLIRHPRRAIPSFYRCTVPPLNDVTGFRDFRPSEAGYAQLRQLVDFLLDRQLVDRKDLVVVDADGMLGDPTGTIATFCDRIGIGFDPGMLEWSDKDTEHAVAVFEKWKGFHDDALSSSSLRPRSQTHKIATVESEDAEWKQKYGEDAQKAIRKCVDDNVSHYEYLRSFAFNVKL